LPKLGPTDKGIGVIEDRDLILQDNTVEVARKTLEIDFKQLPCVVLAARSVGLRYEYLTWSDIGTE
jgi:hypothetical protein